MQGRRKARTNQARRSAFRIHDADLEPRLKTHVRLAPDTAKEAKCLVITTEENMLTVVDTFASGGIGERGGPATERRPRFDDEYASPLLRQGRGSAQAGKTTADHDRINAHGQHLVA